LSIYNVDKNLCDFYTNENALIYIPLVQNYSDGLYLECIFRSSSKEFVDIATEIIGEKRIKILLSKYVIRLQDLISSYKGKEKYFLPIVLCCSFIFQLSHTNNHDVGAVMNLTTGTFKDNASEEDILDCVSSLERKLVFYQTRAKYYAPVKFVLKPFWRFYKKVFRR